MDLGLGIDTGGTFTDAVIIDMASGQILTKAKATTTRQDLRIGIGNALKALDRSLFPRVKLVSLSTTLATNSIVEGKGARVGLITAVPKPESFSFSTNIPAEVTTVIAGAHDHRGQVTTNLDTDAAAAAIAHMMEKVDAFAVSGYFSIYNARHELQLKEMVSKQCSLPVVCGHELSGSVGMVERAVTAVLNARLLPVIQELIEAVRHILHGNRIHAPIMVVKGDGSLISAEVARDRPVETVLSGPAASIAGACRLSGYNDAIVVDMGGTTTDIAVVTNGSAPVDNDGAVVGGWKTRVRAVDMWTVGLGGDSRVEVQSEGRLLIGPRRALPLCAAGRIAPRFLRTLRELNGRQGKKSETDLDFFTLIRRPQFALSRYERALFDALDGNILHRDRIAQEIGQLVSLDRLVALGLLAEVSFTPTDLLHVRGTLDLWDKDASNIGADILAQRMGMDRGKFLDRLTDEITAVLSLQITAKALQEYKSFTRCWSPGNLEFLDLLLRLPERSGVALGVRLDRPVIGVGAPVKAFLPEATTKLGTRLIIPEHAEVANAFGAITGRVVARAEVTIRPHRLDGFHLTAMDVQYRFNTLEEALAVGEEHSRKIARRRAQEGGGREIEVSVAKEELTIPLASGWGDQVFLEIKLTASASGLPAY
ncbi:N-methylhydantoinase A/acetone carboxylase, beta subunit [Syntrophobacter sp. SbD1]|nr:N-methylhydantoinase A/acetone carboxylase, beta subunit [Syntrophobacter sp. SbD1]